MVKEIKDCNFPDDLKKMDSCDMTVLAAKIRGFLIEKVSVTGGHLASNLGITELTIGLHKVFDSPNDKIIWDVGHQSYVHKILTGRADGFDTLRQLDGMSGFPKKDSSVHDFYDTGHSSTSISAACGMAAARDIKGEDYEVIAVIGDGSLTGGMAYEAINNLGSSKSKVIVILNDNGMSISKNIGGVSEHLGNLRTSSRYRAVKNRVKTAINMIPVAGPVMESGISHLKDWIKYAFVSGGVIFEELGITYLGPVDGHNIDDVISGLNMAKKAEGPVLLHVITKKGKGYSFAEDNPDKFHGVGPFDIETGEVLSKSSLTYSKVFGKTVSSLASEHSNVVAVCAAMEDATGLGEFKMKWPSRFYDVGIAEAHGVTFAAGLAMNGMKPYVAIYSTFLQRAYDQILEDICLQKLPVTLAIDRSGIVGADGETHHGIFDFSYLYPMPGMNIFAPATGRQLEEILKYTYGLNEPAAVRYPRGGVCEIDSIPAFEGKNIRIREGKDCDILAVGAMLTKALEAARILETMGISAGVINVCCVKYKNSFNGIDLNNNFIVTLEDNVKAGGFGTNFFAQNPYISKKKLILGWNNNFIEHGDCESLYRRYGLDGKGVAERISEELERKA